MKVFTEVEILQWLKGKLVHLGETRLTGWEGYYVRREPDDSRTVYAVGSNDDRVVAIVYPNESRVTY